MLSPLAVNSPLLAVVRVDCSLGPAALVQASPPLPPCVPSHSHAINSINTLNGTQSTPADTPNPLGHSSPLITPPSIMPRPRQRQLAPTPAPFPPVAPLQLDGIARRQEMDDTNCTCPIPFFPNSQMLIIGHIPILNEKIRRACSSTPRLSPAIQQTRPSHIRTNILGLSVSIPPRSLLLS